MINPVYTQAISILSEFLGAPAQLKSENGARFRRGSGYLLTVYHSNLASGNRAEIAFNPSFVPGINQICALTSHQVNPDRRYNWPRVGIRSSDELNTVVDVLRRSIT